MSFSLLLFVLSIVSSGGGQEGESVHLLTHAVIHFSMCLFSIHAASYNNNSDSLLTSNFQCIAFLQPLFVKCIHQTTHFLLTI